ncbi:MAG TPA: family 20 glycosylhydrolase [Bacteroidales bacterium]|nr:family 20 glycosylhydrolase [Bacteroidales bacterium]
MVLSLRKIYLLSSVLFVLTSAYAANDSISVVPRPAHVKLLPGKFTIDRSTQVLVAQPDHELFLIARNLTNLLYHSGMPLINIGTLTPENRQMPSILLEVAKGKSIPPEGYEMKVTEKGILIRGGGGAGLFYGVQTLLQLLPPGILETRGTDSSLTWKVPCLEIKDQPRFPYRGMHLDVSRHFFPVEFIKEYIDLMAMYKMNMFHWHLTDDNGWRIEILRYPKLMETSAWRVDRENLPWKERPAQQPGERATYGGYYTQDQIREIVQYAKDHYITIIPEIEMPAHSVEVLAAYPQLSCTGGPFTVQPGSYWPNKDIYCAGNDSVFTFLEDVLSEVMDLFPSPYIHIGGDEADKSNWKTCPKCQARMKAEGLKDVDELQSWFIRKIEQFVTSRHRKLIGWDEILEGGLAPEVTVMSWRGVESGIAAAKQGHDVIMTPSGYCYLDYYQASPQTEPKAIGGFTSLKKVYSFNPVPAELSEKEAAHILGSQGNVWTEYLPEPGNVEYMILPRMLALSEDVWTPADLKDWDDFRSRITTQFQRFRNMNLNFSRGSFQVSIHTAYDKKAGSVMLKLESEQPGIPLHYTLNGNDPSADSPVYTAPVELNSNCYIKAGLFVDGKLKEQLSERPFLFHHATGKPVDYLQPYSYRYTAGGDGALTDGLKGTADYREGNWQGFLGNDMDVVIDLGKMQPVHSVAVTFLQNSKDWIFFPDSVVFSLSPDGRKFHSINDYGNDSPKKSDRPQIKPYSQLFPDTPARYVRVRAKNTGVCPPWHEGAGQPCWLFCDEIVVY